VPVDAAAAQDGIAVRRWADGSDPGPGTVADLRERIEAVMLVDRDRLVERLDRVERPERAGRRRSEGRDRLLREVARAEERVERRRRAVPAVTYPESLPVSERRQEISDAIRDHQVVIVAGETGSGKTTQIPKICLELGRGVTGMIGHTQPRRIAARTVAERIAEELDVPLGSAVGYAVRFNDQVGDDTLVKLMTDGILLAEMPRDRLLRRYDTVIIDEAHERSLNIDFLLGYLARLLPQRPDLKVVITSATIDTERFSEHFARAPIVEVSGRAYPVEVRYEPVVDDAERDRDQTEAICDAVEELVAEAPGDILVFLSGEREIRDTADALGRLQLPDTEVLPLYARLSAAEQHRVFRPHQGRRVVLATNVAETSITVPGIRAVVDPGTARVSRYNARTKVQRLPIEPVSQASANQRAGRCGRVGPGVCIRLYSEEDFAGRPEFSDPEILRTNLASVILQMAALGLGAVAEFPFVDPPDGRQIAAGLALLDEIGALEDPTGEPVLTPIGRRLARLPVDPRLGRMILEAERNGCVREVTIVAAGLSIQDPREWPADKRAQAAEHHRRFADADSDFVAYLNLWDYVRERQRELSSSQFRRLCRREFLNFQRVREWQDLVTQLRQVSHDLGIGANRTPAERDALHRSLLAGLLSHIGVRAGDDKPTGGKGRDRRGEDRRGRDYEGARGTRFSIGGGSGLAKKSPRWVMAAELVETNRLWARTVARIEPEWAERLGAHLVKRSYGEPTWDRRRAAAVALERVTLYGVPIVTSRRVDYGRLDPQVAHELFVRHALVEEDWDTRHGFLAANRAAADAVRAVEDRVRRRDLLVDDDAIYELYDERVPASVISGRTFERWYRGVDPAVMRLTPGMLVVPGAGRIRFEDYPDRWEHGPQGRGPVLELSYLYDPLAEDDGVTVHVPLTVLNQVSAVGWDWHVPGFRPDLVAALVRSLPKDLRRNFVPAPEFARAFLQARGPADGPLLDTLADWLAVRAGAPVSLGAPSLEQLPPYLRVTFSVEDGRGRPLAASKDLDALKARLRRPLRQVVAEASASAEQHGLTTWGFGTLPRSIDTIVGDQVVRGYPALVDEGDTVGVRVLAEPDEQDRLMWEGTRRLLLLAVTPPVARAARRLPNDAKLALGYAPHADLGALLADCSTAVVDQLLADAGGPVRDPESWERLVASVRAGVADVATRVVTRTALALSWAHVVDTRLRGLTATVLGPSVDDIRAQLDRLVHPGFVTTTGGHRLIDLIRYLKGIERRLDKLADDPWRDRERMRPIRRLEAELDRLTGGRNPWTGYPEVDAVRWMIEELRVSVWAQMLGTPGPVSEARVKRAIDRLVGSRRSPAPGIS
jgi:ATP-dependent helicase HrpA